eukprot:9784108-Lingulodinium_polyedra.AAC.1
MAESPQHASRYANLRDIAERYPGLSGNALQERVFSDYCITPKDVPLKLLDETGAECLSRHPLNKRNHVAVREQYVANILTQGCIIGVRG